MGFEFQGSVFFGYWSQLLYFFGSLNKSCIRIFKSIFWAQFYSPGASIIMGLHYYHIMLEFCEINSVFESIFSDFAFLESNLFFGFSVSGKVFLGRSEIPNSNDPCL